MTKLTAKKIEGLKEKTILVIGDVMLDEYQWCKVSRISPEAPVPVCRVEKTTVVPGGAANVAFNIQTLACHARIAGLVGKDEAGNTLRSIFNAKKIDTSNLIEDDIKPTILKTRIVAHQQHVVRVDKEDSSPLTRKQQNALLKNIDKEISSCDAILLSDYLKGTLTKSLIQHIISLAQKHKKPVVVDPKGDDYLKYKGATILTPNFSEFETIVKKSITSEKQVLEEGLRLIKKLSLTALLVTRSEKGMSLISNNKKFDIPTQAKEVYDITGAGDTVIATLTIGLASGLSFEDAAFIANFAAGIVVGKVGTSTTTLDEIKTTFSKHIV